MDVACQSFHGYTSNPQLCKGCNRPVFEHVEFMKAHNEKVTKKAAAEYEAKRKKLIELSGTEIDAPEEMVDIGGVKMPISLLEKFRDAFANAGDRKYGGVGMKKL